MDNISDLLRNSGFKEAGAIEEIKERFFALALTIMCSRELRFQHAGREDSWRITSLELYLSTRQISDLWRDPYCHANSAQLNAGTWYS